MSRFIESYPCFRDPVFEIIAVIGVIITASLIALYLSYTFPIFSYCDLTLVYENKSLVEVRVYKPYLLAYVEGYKNKEDYDFKRVGAKGMLFLFDKKEDVVITMKDVRFPLRILTLRKFADNVYIVVNEFTLYPNEEKAVNQIDAFLELDPSFDVKGLEFVIYDKSKCYTT